MVRRTLAIFALLAPFAAEAAAPPLIPITGYLTDTTGAPIDGTQTLHLKLYGATGPAIWTENQTVDVDNGQFTVYLGDVTTVDLQTFKDNGALFLGVAVGTGSEMTPRFELATAPFAGYAQYCDDADTVGGIDPADFLQVGDAITWNSITDRPTGLDDGDQGANYLNGAGLNLAGTTFSVDQPTIDAWAKAAALDNVGELTALLDTVYMSRVSCTNNQLLVANSSGAFVCTDASTFGTNEATVDGYVANNGYAAAAALTALTGRVATAEASIAALGNTPGNMIAQYQLDEVSGSTTFVDSSGLGNDVTQTSGIVAGSGTSHSGRSVAFAAATGLMLATGNQMPSSDQVHAEVWMRTGDVAQTSTLFEKAGAWKMRMVGSRAEWTVTTTGGNCAITHTTPLVTNTWTHIAGWADGLTASVEVNGIIQTVTCTTGPIVPAAGSAFTIGGRNTGTWSEVFNGNLDEVRIRPTAPSTPRGPSIQITKITLDWRNNSSVSGTGVWNAIPGRSVSIVKQSPTSTLRISYQDTLGTLGADYGTCNWRILVDATQEAYFSDADITAPASWRMSNATHTALATGYGAGAHTITVQSLRSSTATECLMGWNAVGSYLSVEEVQ